MSLIQTDVTDGVATLTLDDQERRNSITLPMVGEITDAMDAFEADESVGAVVVTGAGKGFCAGADLGTLKGSGDGSVGSVYEAFLRIARSPLVSIAAVNGAAVGAGMNLALCCDIRLVSTRARFITRFMELGLHPGGGHTWMLRRAVGPHHAAAMLLTGEELRGAEAVDRGLAWSCHEPDELMEAARTMAARTASYPGPVVRMTKANLARMADVETHDEAVAIELEDQLWTLNQPWFEERIAAIQQRITSR